MDSIDYQIIRLLQENARTSVKKIAEIVTLTAPAVAERIRKLEESDIIIGYRAIINPIKLGKTIRAIINVTLKAEKRKEFLLMAHKNDNVIECHHVTGSYSMTLNIIAREMSELEELIGQIQQYGNTQTLIVLSTPIKHKAIT